MAAVSYKIVLDTNVFIQSFMRPGSFLDVVIQKALAGDQVRLYTSHEIMLELRQKAETKFQLLPEESAELVQTCRALCAVVDPTRRITRIEDDPDDNKVLECAVEAGADMIITADKDLLKLKFFEGITIAHPSMMKYWFGRDGGEA